MADNYSHLLEENANLKKGLAKSRQIIEETSNDYETLKQIHEEYKIQGDRLRKENDDLNIRCINLMNDKKELENQFDSTIRNLKIAIEQKQREIEEIQTKVIPSFDHDMLRIKIINELEMPHKYQLDQKQEEVEKQQEFIYELKRDIEIINNKTELIQKEHLRQLSSLKDRQQLEVNEYMQQIQDLNDKLEDNRDKELIRKLKRDTEEAKLRANSKELEADELRRDRDAIRNEKNENLIKFSKQLEQERSDKRLYKSESEKLQIRARFLEEEVKKNKIRLDSFNNEVEIGGREKDSMNDEMRKKDDMIHQLQRRIAEVEEEHLQSESRSHEHSMKVYNDEHEKFLDERNKNIGVTREFEQLRKHYDELNEENKTLRMKINKDLSQLRTENMTLQEETNKQKRSIGSLQKVNEEIEKQTDKREKHINEQERELEALRKKYRDSLQRVQTIEAQNDDLQIKVQNASKNPYNEGSQAQTAEMNKIERQNEKLKQKLKDANSKIVELLQKKVDNRNNQTISTQQQNQTFNQTFQQTSENPLQNQTIAGGDDKEIMDRINQMYGHKF